VEASKNIEKRFGDNSVGSEEFHRGGRISWILYQHVSCQRTLHTKWVLNLRTQNIRKHVTNRPFRRQTSSFFLDLFGWWPKSPPCAWSFFGLDIVLSLRMFEMVSDLLHKPIDIIQFIP